MPTRGRCSAAAASTWSSTWWAARAGRRCSTSCGRAAATPSPGPSPDRSSLDLRKLYLKDLTFFGCTTQGDEVFADLVGYAERGEIRPHVARTYPLRAIVEAQQDFIAKKHVGKLVLLPP